MLVLSRKEGEQLLIGDNIVLTVNRVSGNRVAIGIEAPREVPIVRGELDRVETAKRESGGTGIAAGLSTLLPSSSVSVASGAGH